MAQTLHKDNSAFNFTFKLSWLCLALLSQVGCSEEIPVDSDTVATGNIYANMNITHTQDGNAVIEMQMRKGGAAGEYVRLTGDDRLITATREIINTPTPGRLFDDLVDTTVGTQLLREGSKRIETIWGDISVAGPWYIAEFDNVVGTETFYLSLEREFDQDAINSNVTFPPEVVITAPDPQVALPYSRSSDIIINWDPSPTVYTMSIKANLACEDGSIESWPSATFTATDPGTVTIPGSTFNTTVGLPCSLKILVERSRLGTLHNNFLGGSIRAHNQASVTIQTTN